MISISAVIILIIIGLLIGFWQSSLRAREQAVTSARAACKERQLQFLDESMQFSKIRLRRNASGRVTLARWYQFEYFDGELRTQGIVEMLGNDAQKIHFANRQAHNKPIYKDNVIPFRRPDEKKNNR